MQQLQIVQHRISTKNPQNVNVQFRGSFDRSTLPTNFVGANSSINELLVISLGLNSNDKFNFTVWWTFDKDVFAKHCSKNADGSIKYPTDINALFNGKKVVAVVARTTYDAGTTTPVSNPTTGEVKTFEGLDVYQYATLAVGNEHKALFLGHECPPWLVPANVDIQNNSAE